LENASNPPSSPFAKGGNISSPFGKREAGRDLRMLFQSPGLII
jgi:hypothetical protein